MKKKFIEPELVRIDLKMTENIATSEGERFFRITSGYFKMFATRQYVDQCRTFMARTDILFDWAINEELTLEQEDLLLEYCRYRDVPIE